MPSASLRHALRASVSGLPGAFWWLWTSTLVNRLGGFVSTMLAIYLTLDRGYSASYAGLVAALYGLGGVVASLGGGVMADRLGRRPTMLVAQVATALSVGLLGFVSNPLAIASVACLVGLATHASRPAVQAMMADIVRPEDRMRAFSFNYWAINLGFAVSSTAAGFVAEVSYRAGFLFEAGMTLACAVVVFLKLPESRPEPSRKLRQGSGTDSGTGTGSGTTEVRLGVVLRDRRFMGVVGLCYLVAVVFQQGSVALPVAMGRAGFTPADYGMAIAVNGILVVALQIPVTRLIEHRDPRRLLAASSLLAGYGFGLTAFAGSLGIFVLTVCVWTLAEIVNAPTQTGLVVRLSPVHGRGRYQGVFSLSWSLAALTAPLLSGFVIDRFGADWLWGTCAVIGMAAAAGFLVLMRGLSEAAVEEGPESRTSSPPQAHLPSGLTHAPASQPETTPAVPAAAVAPPPARS